ncbi:MAG TPA: EAL domain-containing protein [Thermoanaerobaculia bacterium]|nr:EAL domain-containing protein [Thermoanaerobaculia bacterium]
MPSIPAYLPSLLGAALIIALSIPLAARRRATQGFGWFAALLVAAFVWCAADYAEGLASTLAGKATWSRAQYLASAVIPPIWLLFAAAYTGRRRAGPSAVAALFLVPAITWGLVWTIHRQPLLWREIALPERPSGNLVVEYGPWFWAGLLGYGALLVLLADALLLAAWREESERARRRQLIAMVLASLVPLGLSVLYLVAGFPSAELDLTPLGLGLAAATLGWSLHRHGLFDLMPIAFRRVMQTIPDLLLVVDREQRVVFANAAAERLSGRRSGALTGQPVTALWPDWRRLLARGASGHASVLEVEPRAGEVRELELRLLPLGEPARPDGHVVLGRDVSERRSFERRIEEMAYRDALTGLPNRRSLLEFAERVLSMARRGQGEAALLFLDLQRFKEVNDALGHSVGDRLLRSVAGRLAAITRTENMLARIGGDEFAAILQSCGDENARGAARRMLEQLAEPFELDGASLHVAATAGIALYPVHGVTVSDLLRHADMAMYQARKQGRSIGIFDPDDQLFTAEHLRLESDLRVALAGSGLFLEYQPIVDGASGETVAVEALLRWRHPARGVLAPEQFLPVARRRGMMGTIDRFVLRRALAELAAHRLDIAVNVAGSTLTEEGFPGQVAEALSATAVEPRRLILEITETELVLPERARPVIDRIRALGVRIATDDFGSGYSSLNYLRTLPLDVVKVDRSLVEAIGRGAEDEAILAAILRVAQSLSLSVVAEGVERVDQRDWLERHTCGLLQGFLFAHPTAIERLPLRFAARPDHDDR